MGNLRPASNSYVARQAPRGKEIIWMNIMRTLARVMCAARDKNHNVFAARCGKTVAHHWIKVIGWQIKDLCSSLCVHLLLNLMYDM